MAQMLQRIWLYSGLPGFSCIITGVVLLVAWLFVIACGRSKKVVAIMTCLSLLPLTNGLAGTMLALWEGLAWVSLGDIPPARFDLERYLYAARTPAWEGIVLTGVLAVPAIICLLLGESRQAAAAVTQCGTPQAKPEQYDNAPGGNADE